MSEENKEYSLESLKEKATKLGVAFHPNIGLDKLKKKLAAEIGSDPEDPIEDVSKEPEFPAPTPANTRIAPPIVTKLVESAGQRRARLLADASRLVRIRVTCMNPSKREYEGEIFTVSNSVVGTFRKYVPYNSEEGWHVPNMIYQHLKERECQVFYTKKVNGEKKRVGKLIKEMAIEVLDPLKEDEIHELAVKQAMANSKD